MGNKGVRVVGIFGILVIVLVMVINIPMNTQPNPQTSNCELFENDGSCAKFEYDTIVTENLNSFIDANNDLTQVPSVDVGSEKIILITNSVLLDSNQEIVSNSTDKIAFEPATLLDLQKNILDLGSVQMTFDIRYKKNANVFFDGEAEVFLDGVPKGKRYLSFNGQLPENTVRVNVDKESRLLSDRTKTLTFTLADEGKDWVDGSVHLLEIKVKNLKAQVMVNGEKQNFDLGNDFPVYRLEMTVDQAKQVTFDENHNAIAVFKSDGIMNVCSVGYYDVVQANGNPAIVSTLTPKISIFKSNSELIGIIEPFKQNDYGVFSGKPYSSTYKECKKITGIPRSSDISVFVGDVEYAVTTSVTRPELNLSTEIGDFKFSPVGQYGGRIEYIEMIESNFGYNSFNNIVVNR